MSHEDEQLLKFGRELYRMATDVLATDPSDNSYCRRDITTRGASFVVMIVKRREHADQIEQFIKASHDEVLDIPATDPGVKQ